MAFSETSVIELIIQGKDVSGQNVFNVFHYRQSDTAPTVYDNDDLAVACAEINTDWLTNIIPLLSVNYSYQTIRGRALTGTIANPTPPPPTQLVVGEQFDLVLPAPISGTRVGDVLPTYAAVAAQKLSSRAGRNFRGGARFSTIREADTQANLLETGAYLALCVANITAFYAATLSLNFGASIWEMAIFSRTLALAAPPPFSLLRDLTSKVVGAKVNPFISSQVSRKQSPTKPT